MFFFGFYFIQPTHQPNDVLVLETNNSEYVAMTLYFLIFSQV